jgi:hypothetical protein
MPPFRDHVTDRQVNDLVAYVRGLGPELPTAFGSSADDFERRFRQLEEEMAALKRDYQELMRRRHGQRRNRAKDQSSRHEEGP